MFYSEEKEKKTYPRLGRAIARGLQLLRHRDVDYVVQRLWRSYLRSHLCNAEGSFP